jgi:anti-sigma B factor antagonist
MVEFCGVIGGIPVIRVSGDADVSVAAALRNRVHESQGVEHPTVIIDLDGATFVDSTILGILVAASRTCRTLGGELRLVISERRIRRVFEITGLTDIFAMYPTLEIAFTAE